MATLDQPPPGYTPMSFAAAPDPSTTEQQLQFDIVPRSDATSFQAGYLGLQHEGFQAWVKGDVLLKLDGADSQKDVHSWGECTITLTATESAGDQSILLFTSSQQLWKAPVESSSAASSSTSTAQAPSPPAVMPFSFELTPDLPHCIHLPTSSLVYQLHARLHASSSQAQDTTRTVPVHLTRYTSPGKLAAPTSLPAAASASTWSNAAASSPGPSAASASSSTSSSEPQRSFSSQPHVWHLHYPVPLAIRLRKSILRRAEPIELHFRIPPPPTLHSDGQGGESGSRTYAEKGLRLRSVEADLVRVVRVKRDQPEEHVDTSASGKGRDTLAPSDRTGVSDDERAGRQELLLAHSGKLARFHSKRAIQLRLTLHPPFDRSNMPFPHPDHDAALSGPVYGRGGGGGCESISQETLLHDIRFEVRARVGLSGDRGENRDVRVTREVWIAPGAIGQGAGGAGTDDGDATSSTDAASAPPGEKGRSSKAREAVDHVEVIDQRAEDGFEGFHSEDEYDGYEDVGRSLLDEGDEEGEGDTWRSEEQEALALQAALWPEDAVLDAVSHAEATASYERLTRSGHTRPAYSSEDPVTQARSPSNLPSGGLEVLTADIPRRSTSLERTPSHHQRRLEQLRVLLEQRERQMYRGGRGGVGAAGLAANGVGASGGEAVDDPPPSLLESQHDLQVEVEVEGVGSAMPRSLAPPSGLDAQAFHQLSLDPASGVVVDDGELPPFGAADLRGYSAREARGIPDAGMGVDVGEDDQLPPPPISPPLAGHALTAGHDPHQLRHGHAHSHGHGHDDAFPPPPPLSPPPPALAPHEDGQTMRSVGRERESGGELHGSEPISGPRSVQPPPYIAGALSGEGLSGLNSLLPGPSTSRGAPPRHAAVISVVPPPLPARPSDGSQLHASENHGPMRSIGLSDSRNALHEGQGGEAAPPPAYPPAYAQASPSRDSETVTETETDTDMDRDRDGGSNSSTRLSQRAGLRDAPPALPPRSRTGGGGSGNARTQGIRVAQAENLNASSVGPPRYEA